MTIDGKDVYTEWGCKLLEGSFDDLLKYPKRKAVKYDNWAEADGIDPDLSVPPKLLPSGCKTLPLEAISDIDFIIPGEGSNYDIGRILRTAGVRPRVKYSVSDDYAAVAMAEGGLGMTIVPELILKGIGGNRAAVELEPACTRTIGIAERSIGTGSPACAAFMRFTENWVKRNSEDAIQ